VDILNLKSNLRRKIITLFYTNPEEKYYVRQLERLTGFPASNISSDLRRLNKDHLFNTEKVGNVLLYQINKEHPLYPELKNIIYKTTGLNEAIRDNLNSISNINVAVIYGSVAKEKERAGSDIDLLIIGTPDEDRLYNVISEIESHLNREVNFITYSPREWNKQVKDKNSFIMDILNNKLIFLIGDMNELSKLGK